MITELYNEYCLKLNEIVNFFRNNYKKEIYPSLEEFLKKIDDIPYNNVQKFFKDNNIKLIDNEWFNKYFYSLMKGKTYWFEFADLQLKDIKSMIKECYSSCLSEKGVKWFKEAFETRFNTIPFNCLPEYSGKNRNRKTIKEENKFITEKEIYYLNPLIDDLYKTLEYDKIDTLMGTKVVNIRGTNGSGKSTRLKELIKKFNEVEESVWDEFTTEEITTYHKVYTRKAQIWNKQKILIMGIYTERQTGGVDNYDTPWQIMYGLLYFCKKYQGYTIIFEGIRVSTNYPYWYKVFSILRDKGVIVKIISLLPSDLNWAINNVKERRKDKNLWELRNQKDIVDNNYEIFKNSALFLSRGFQVCIMSPDKYETISEQIDLIRYML